MNRGMNRAVLLRRAVQGLPSAEDFVLTERPMPVPGPGEVLVRNSFLSLDPYMLSAIKGRHMSGAADLDQTMQGDTVGTVVGSNDAVFAIGTRVIARGGWQEFSVLRALPAGAGGIDTLTGPYARPLPPADPDIADSAYLGVLGMPGLTAWAGTAILAPPEPGACFVVSAATGAVGSIAGQIARNLGARVVGIAGSAEKCVYAVEALGFAACVNHRAGDFPEQLAAACPNRIDGYFDNVGGRILDVVLQRLALRARIVLCGMIEQYQAETRLPGPSLAPVIGRRAHMMGLVVYDHVARLAEWQQLASQWIREDRLRWREDRAETLAAAPAAFVRLMQGQNFGKTVVVL
jgi:NADPH-dependent curcumin reductase CurA